MSCASLTGVVALENARQVPGKGKTLIFDAQFYLGETSDTPPEPITMVGGLRYYNSNNLSFSQPGLYFVHAIVAKYEKKAYDELYSSVLGGDDYDIVGDIIMLIPIPNADKDTGRHIPLLQVCGSVFEADKNSATFVINAEQRTQVLTDGILPVTAAFPTESARFKNKIPLPGVGTIVYVCGPISDVRRIDNGAPDRFHFSVEQIQFLAKSPVPPRAINPTPPKAPGRKKLQFNFTPNNSSSPPPALSPLSSPQSSPARPQTPTPSSNTRASKRARTDS
ncbi:hypothetical protein GLOTRDRAFT_113548 [Gloeophyllum trabeum ATCC 11539]|uniref:Uncharacterized protein n=1 Tax=Gloeophyllum trabeum (strain ATCC 11539 / FP-39264 / Madison 617) TaxID=670483 RepID=S7QNJ9_GLOTA|nr:uncharacterized protein GLOTRDRAFT_113548 [Gloeophyllum trabeum ATCC 11539]EPQ61093.1 hypothetical protein GLOTRDRAFT_113548 [Gloeophyllum trabeum ATCC 11539]